MRWSDIPRNPSDRTLRQFAGLCLLIFGGLAGWRLVQDGPTPLALVLGAAALGLGLPGLVRPRLLRPVFVGWMMLTFPIGWLMSQVILLLMFGLVITPIGLCFKAIGRDALGLRRTGPVTSYWRPKPMPVDVRRYFRQY
jgi:hypothetical protein